MAKRTFLNRKEIIKEGDWLREKKGRTMKHVKLEMNIVGFLLRMSF